MDFASNDIHNMQVDSEHVPNPVVSDRRSSVFHLPLGFRVVYVSKFIDYSSVNLLVFFQLSCAP